MADEATPLFAAADESWRGDIRETHSSRAVAGPDAERFIALDSDEPSPFLRAQKRVSVRRGPVTKKTANRLKQVCIAAGVMAAAATCAVWLYRYAELAPRFRVESSDQIAVSGAQNVSRAQVLEVFGGDIGRNVFFIPISDRKRQLERIPWVESAAVMRLLPNQLQVAVEERKPVAFAEVAGRILLIDSNGVLLEPASTKTQYSFPVIIGMGVAEPLSTRAPRMRIYTQLVRELDSGGARYSADLSEVDLRDPEDVRVTVADDDGAILVHLGGGNFLERFKTYISHVQAWREQYHKIESVDLRFDKQVIVHPDLIANSATPANVGAGPLATPAPSKPTASKLAKKPARHGPRR